MIPYSVASNMKTKAIYTLNWFLLNSIIALLTSLQAPPEWRIGGVAKRRPTMVQPSLNEGAFFLFCGFAELCNFFPNFGEAPTPTGACVLLFQCLILVFGCSFLLELLQN